MEDREDAVVVTAPGVRVRIGRAPFSLVGRATGRPAGAADRRAAAPGGRPGHGTGRCCCRPKASRCTRDRRRRARRRGARHRLRRAVLAAGQERPAAGAAQRGRARHRHGPGVQAGAGVALLRGVRRVPQHRRAHDGRRRPHPSVRARAHGRRRRPRPLRRGGAHPRRAPHRPDRADRPRRRCRPCGPSGTGWAGAATTRRQEMLDVADGMREHEVPCDVLHVDPDWLVVDRLNCDFIWNTERFGDRKEFVEQLRRAARGCRCGSCRTSTRRRLVTPRPWRRGTWCGEPTAASPRSRRHPRRTAGPARWSTSPTRRRGAGGRSCTGRSSTTASPSSRPTSARRCPDDVALHDGTPPQHAHNLYPLVYNRAVSEMIGEVTGRSPLVWGRSGWAGSQRYPGQWGGDAESTVAGMRATVRGGLSYAVSAPGFWSHDIGGFFGPELTPALYVRWSQLGALSPLMRAHGLRPREPWQFGDRALDVVRDWVRLRYSLLPYLWQVAQQAADRGWPVMRPTVMADVGGTPSTEALDSQFLLGDDLLVVPVFDDGEAAVQRRFFVPAGGWTDLLTAERFTGPGWHEVEVPLERMPVLVRDGAVVPRVDVDSSVRSADDLLDRPWTLHAFGAVPHEVTLTDFSGASRAGGPRRTRVVRTGCARSCGMGDRAGLRRPAGTAGGVAAHRPGRRGDDVGADGAGDHRLAHGCALARAADARHRLLRRGRGGRRPPPRAPGRHQRHRGAAAGRHRAGPRPARRPCRSSGRCCPGTNCPLGGAAAGTRRGRRPTAAWCGRPR